MTGTLIIGGGAIGLSLAYHLAHRGEAVTLLERGRLTSGTSWHAAGIVGPLRATPNMTRLAMYAGTLFPALEQECGLSTGYRQTEGYWLARAPERMDELHRIAALGQHMGLTPTILAADEIDIPGIDPAGLAGGMHVVEDGNVNPVDLCMAYAKCARALGAVIHEQAPVAAILAENGRAKGVRLADGRKVLADRVALCAGAWSRRLAEAAGVALPLQAVEHMYVVTAPMLHLPQPYPVLRDLDRGIYIKGDAGKLVIGGFEPDAKCWDAYGPDGDRAFLELPEDWEQFTPFMEAALELIPDLAETGIQHFMNGPESFTVDSRPLIGETPELRGLYVAAGMNSVGVMSSAGIGRILGDWIADDAPPSDLWEVDVARADPQAATEAHIQARMHEAVADVFALHWPFKQPKAGRGVRESALHDAWAGCGAVFGQTAGWERGLWYAQSDAERDLPYSVRAPQPWQAIATREAAVMETGTGLLDLSPFGKFDVTGPAALELLQWLCVGNVDMAPGRALYTQMLNDKGGIEADLTVTRHAPQHFRLTSGAATRRRDLAWLTRHSAGRSVQIRDVTEDEAVIGVMGAGAREVLQAVSDADWQDFAFSTARTVRVADVAVTATRISFVGELGWELSIPAEQAKRVFDALLATGAQPMGHYALESCRIEKGFRHWGHDLGPEITPLEAGLGFCVNWQDDFLGKPALMRQRAEGLRRRMVLMRLEGTPLMLHDEPIVEAGRVIGLTTSGGIGARSGLVLTLGLIEIAKGETLGETVGRALTVKVGGRCHAAQVLRAPPFDPKGERMRG